MIQRALDAFSPVLAHLGNLRLAVAGGEIAELVRRMGRTSPSVHTIVLADGAAQAERCLAAGAADVLLKGWLDERLSQLVLLTKKGGSA
jgi:DNA-binding NarL/FixJ family response regulator